VLKDVFHLLLDAIDYCRLAVPIQLTRPQGIFLLCDFSENQSKTRQLELLHWQLVPFNEGLKRKAGALEPTA